MAVEATHPIFCPQEILLNRGRGNLVDVNGNMHMFGNSMRYGMIPGSVSGTTTTATENLIPMCVTGTVDDCFPIKDAVKSESGLTYVGRKRSRDDDMNNYSLLSSRVNQYAPCFQNLPNNSKQFFKGKTSFQNQQQEQFEIDYLISQHTQKMRIEMEEKRRNNSIRMITTVEEIISKKSAAKDEEISKISKINFVLEERVQSLCVENQIWRQLAQSNEATANALRSNLEQVLALVNYQDDQQHHHNGGATAADDDAESCCDSSYPPAGGSGGVRGGDIGGNRRCINCGKEEAGMLFLPCRHLCVCNTCGPVLDRCPLCNSAKNGCIHVIL